MATDRPAERLSESTISAILVAACFVAGGAVLAAFVGALQLLATIAAYVGGLGG